MSQQRQSENSVKTRRLSRGWSQADLAERAGISRPAVSAIEMRRLVPSVTTALALARVLECTVEDLFRPEPAPTGTAWAWQPTHSTCRFWQARLAERTLLYPVEATAAGVVPHDGRWRRGKVSVTTRAGADATLVMACCDPAAGLLAAEFARTTPFRLLVLPRSSGEALDLLGRRLVHIAGVHLASARDRDGNSTAIRERLGGGYSLLRGARWQEGIVLGNDAAIRSIGDAVRSGVQWIGRESGSGARQCLDALLGPDRQPRRVARDHRGVAEAVRCGWADAGICVRLVAEELGLRFLSVREEAYDLCYRTADAEDPRIRALLATVQSGAYRRLIGELPGYESRDTGEVRRLD
jgi:molybdate-binding protein/DNA-binding XRE family transcriptional regulator